MRISSLFLLTSLLLPLACPLNAHAADDEDRSAESGDESPGKTEGADVRVEGEDGEKESVKELDPSEIDRAKKAEEANSPEEKKNNTYYFVGARYRGLLIPSFMMSAFADGGTSVYSNGIGPEFTVRKDNFEYVLSVWYADYSMGWTRFKAKNDPTTSWEFVRSKMAALYLTSDFNWTSQISPVFGLNFGLGAGVGFFWGDLTRTEAYRKPGGGWDRCDGAGRPGSSDTWDGINYCANDEQYKYNEPNWANGGSKPIVFPWLALQTGVRIKPHRNVMMRVDLGWAIIGPFFGISGNYGI